MGLIRLFVRFFIFAPLLKKLGDKKTLVIGLVAFFISYVWLIFLDQLWEYLAVYLLIGFGAACTFAIMSGLMSRSVRKDRQGEMMGLSAAADNVTHIIGPSLGSYLLSLPMPFIYGIVPAFFSLVALLLSQVSLENK
jgi:DHA1 family tetracycline resistance protein-like MFS transporter